MLKTVILAVTAATLVCSVASVPAQQPASKTPTESTTRTSTSTRTVTGTVKQAKDNGLVVMGHDAGTKDKEWAFLLDAGTRIDSAGQTLNVTDLRQGDPVTVTFMSRDGKVIAQSVKVNPR